MRKYIPFVLFISFLFSCNKTPMKGSLTRFVGVWEWDYSMWYYTNNSSIYMYSDTVQFSSKIEITKKGEMLLFKNNSQIEKINLKIWNKEQCEEFEGNCGIGLENNSLTDELFYIKQNQTEFITFSAKRFPYPWPSADYPMVGLHSFRKIE